MFIQVIDHGSIVSCSHRWKYCTTSGSCVWKKDWGELICHLGGCDTKTACGCIIIGTNVTTTAATATMPHVSAVQTAAIALVSVQIRVRALVVRAAAVATAVRVGPVGVQIRVRAVVVRAAAVAAAVAVGPVSAITTTTIDTIQMILTQTIAFWPFKDVVVPTDCLVELR